MRLIYISLCLLSLLGIGSSQDFNLPFVINTWAFTNATEIAYAHLSENASSIDSVVEGCSAAEDDLSIGSVGYGGSPDEHGYVLLDSMVFDGQSMNVGSVASMPYIKNAIRVAKEVLYRTEHTLLVGKSAAEFAISCGFTPETLENDQSKHLHYAWLANKCQPNYRVASQWTPDPRSQCGPYKATKVSNREDVSFERPKSVTSENHDTIGMIVIDKEGNIAVGTSTNGAIHKVPGRVGDTPIPGAGGYANNLVGASVATGDGDIILRYSLTFRTVHLMEQGKTPKESIEDSLKSLKGVKANVALIAVNNKGVFAAGCVGFGTFPYSVRGNKFNTTSIITIQCN